MKLSKILLTTVAAAAVIGLTSCGSGDDDPNKMIKGSNSKYSIDYTNDGSTISRGYKDTYYKHAGAAVELTFENQSASTAGAGVMGLIFDLDTVDKSTNKRNFDVVGVRTVDGTNKLEYYISRYTGVVDIQDDNFGAYEAGKNGHEVDGPATEIEYVKTWGTADGTVDGDKVTVTAYAIQKKINYSGNDTAGKHFDDGEWVYQVYLLNNEIKKINKKGELIDKNGNVVDLEEGKNCLATIATGYTGEKPTQQKLAVYANVYPSEREEGDEGITGCGTLTGKWTFHGDYYACDVEED